MNFHIIIANLESDHFGRLDANICILRNMKNQVLITSQGNQPMFEDMPDLDCRGTVCIYICKHRNDKLLFPISFYFLYLSMIK